MHESLATGIASCPAVNLPLAPGRCTTFRLFLCEIGLLDYVGLPGLFELTAFGRAYLSAVEGARKT